MRFISTRLHGALDYLTGTLLIVAPWMMKFGRGGAETWIMITLGSGAVLYSLLTDYEWGVAKVFSMRTHLMFDLLSGILLAVSPWLFGFSEHVCWPHVVLGVFEIGASLVTQTTPSRGAAEHSRPM